jgi:Domain of unknown function (DUF4263)
MKEFKHFEFSPRICRQELNELKEHLDNNFELNERKDVLPFFQSREHLSAFIGSYFPYISKFDRIAYEYDIFGDFKADLAIGDSKAGWYSFVEFEGASETSIFEKKGVKVTPEWSVSFEHGFSQLVDWFWKLSSLENTREFINRFGREFTGYEGMLVIGRSERLEQRERDRLRWRRDRLMVNSKHIHCVTFDELYAHLDARLLSYEAAFLADIEE